MTLSFIRDDKENLNIELFLSWGSAVGFSCAYSDFSPISTEKPWALKPLEFFNYNIEEKDGGINVLADGVLFSVYDKFNFNNGLLCIEREWRYNGKTTLASLALGVRIPAGNGIKEKITIPHVIYNDNPAAAPDRLVPHLRKETGYALVMEEHRLPIPAVNVEWMNAGKFLSLTFLTVPSQTPGGESWSLGGIHNEKNLEILCLSGVVAFNNRKDFIYGAQNREFECPDFGYLTVKPGDVIRKTIAIDFSVLKQEGRGFAGIVRRGMELLKPKANPVLSIKETIALKENALLRRWRAGESVSGFTWIPETTEEGNVYSARPGFLFGWVGQSLRLAWCAIDMGVKRDKAWLAKGLAVMDSFANAPEAGGTSGLKYLFYDCNEKFWSGSEHRVLNRISSRMTGESLANLAECILLLRKHGLNVKEEYLTSLRRGADFLCSPLRLTQDGIYPTFFSIDGSPTDNLITGGGTACIDAVLAASTVLDDEKLLEWGLEILECYYELFGKTMERPFSCATLDAFCEDKESGIYFFLAAYRAFKITGREIYAEYSKLAAEWISTYVYFWDTGFKKGSICERNGFDSTFWPGVSVQNMHLDVFFPAYELYEFGKTIGDVQLAEIGKGVVAAWSHGIAQYPGHWGFSTPGEQGEQFNHTNYFQGRFTQDDWRCSANRWNPSWIIALVLQAAIRFDNES